MLNCKPLGNQLVFGCDTIKWKGEVEGKKENFCGKYILDNGVEIPLRCWSIILRQIILLRLNFRSPFVIFIYLFITADCVQLRMYYDKEDALIWVEL